MTSIPANERIGPTQPIEPGQVERNEFEYIPLGTQCLLAYWHIAKGQIITPSIKATRTEVDFLQHIEQTIDTDSDGGWIFRIRSTQYS